MTITGNSRWPSETSNQNSDCPGADEEKAEGPVPGRTPSAAPASVLQPGAHLGTGQAASGWLTQSQSLPVTGSALATALVPEVVRGRCRGKQGH